MMNLHDSTNNTAPTFIESWQSVRFGGDQWDTAHTRRRKRHVHFSADADRVHVVENAMNFDEDIQGSLFGKRKDIMETKRDARKIAFQVAEADQQNDGDNTYARVLWKVHTSCSRMDSPPPSDREALAGWIDFGDCWRGLERWCIPDLDLDRRAQRMAAIGAVVDSATDRSPELLAGVYEHLSQPAKRFARVVGEADAVAAGTSEKKMKNKKQEEEKSGEEKRTTETMEEKKSKNERKEKKEKREKKEQQESREERANSNFKERPLRDSYVMSRSTMMVRSCSGLKKQKSRRHLMQLGKAESFKLF